MAKSFRAAPAAKRSKREPASKHPRHRCHPVPGISCACNKCPHLALNTLEKLRDCLANGTPEITWQPEFDRAREVVTRSLLG